MLQEGNVMISDEFMEHMADRTEARPETADIDFKRLTEHILQSYLTASSIDDMEILSLLDENMSVIGTGKHEFWKNLKEFLQSFCFEAEQRENIRFHWQNFHAKTQQLDDVCVLVYGSVLIIGSFEGSAVSIRMDTRFTMLYGWKDGKWKVLHIHHSVPDKDQTDDEEFPRSLGTQIVEAQDTIMALSEDYVAVYMIEPEADRASVVKLNNKIRSKARAIPESFCYSQMFRHYADRHISEEDRDNFLHIVMPDALVRSFADGREKMEMNYRACRNGRQDHYSGLFIRMSSPGEPLRLIVGFRNIEDVIDVQKEVSKSHEKIEDMYRIFASSRMGTWNIYLLDGKAPAMKADNLMKELLGVAGQELTPEEIYNAWFSNIDPNAVQSVLDSVERMKHNSRDENTYLWKHPVLGERYVRCGGTARLVEGGYILSGYHYDVDDVVREQKKRSKELAEQISITQTLSKSFRNVFVANLDTGTARVIRLSDSYQVKAIRDVVGHTFSFDAVVKQWIQENVHPEDRQRIAETVNVEKLREVFSRQDTCTGIYRSMEAGVMHHYQYDLRRIDHSANVVAGFQLVDGIIEEHQAQEKKRREMEAAYQKELIAAKQEAERANSAKTDFLLRMSHDIRTPLNGIMGMLEIAQRYREDISRRDECHRKVKEAASVLLELVNEVLDMSKLESGKIVLEHIPFDLKQLSRSVSMLIVKQAENRRIQILEEDCSVPHYRLVGSPAHYRRILTNILSNAIKYNKDNGKIYVTCREVSCDGDMVNIEFKCRDTGIGMSKEFQKHLFEPFQQENATARSQYGGTGLGMAITRKLTDALGGSISMESEKGVGTVFDVIVPFEIDRSEADDASAEAAETTAVSLQGFKILLAEDNALNMEIAKFLLEEEDAQVIEAVNGREAVEAFEKSSPFEIDAVLMDIMMPIMNGYEATRAIRALDRPDAKHVPIIAMTANAFAEDRVTAKEAGMSEHLAKPLNMKLVLQTVAKCVGEYRSNID